MGTHLITGATGLVGGAIALRLLETTSDDVHCVIRGDVHADARARLDATLTDAARLYDQLDIYAAHAHRVHAVLGDVSRPLCGVDTDALPEITRLWHCAASLKYTDRHATEIYRSNVDGTGHAMELARTLGAELNHISTAYACPPGAGVRREVIAVDHKAGPNHYVKSKILAEQLVSRSDVPWRILRPSLVVGHSRTYGGRTKFGLYGVATISQRFQGVLNSTFGGLLRKRTVRLTGEPENRVNFIPIDAVAELAVTVGLNGPLGTIYHLTNPTPPSYGDTGRAILNWSGFPPPTFVPVGTKLRGIDWAIHDALEFYSPYMQHDIDFDRTNTEAVAGVGAGGVKLSEDTMVEMLRWFEQNRRYS